MGEDITAKLDLLEIEYKELKRRVDAIQKSIDLLSQDRAILEDILTSLTSLRDTINTHRQHSDNVIKDVKADIKDQSQETQDAVQEVRDVVQEAVQNLVTTVEKKKVIVAIKNDSLFQKIVKIFKRG